MNSNDFRRLIGAANAADEYVPVACLLSTGYGCAGYYNGLVNSDIEDTCVLINARLVELERQIDGSRARVSDFNDFIADIVATQYRETECHSLPDSDLSSGSIPLTAIPFSDIALLYPVAHIATLLKKAKPQIQTANGDSETPSFLDFDNKSIVVKALRAKLW